VKAPLDVATARCHLRRPWPLQTSSLCNLGAVVSRAIVKKNAGTLTLFAFDIGQGLSEHSAPFDAVVEILDGEAETDHRREESPPLAPGRAVLMPANVPHALSATTPFRCCCDGARGRVGEAWLASALTDTSCVGRPAVARRKAGISDAH